jgi:hypothetical protein
VRDAEAVRASLLGLGFPTVVGVEDADDMALREALVDFEGQLRPGAVALVYFSGHVVESNKEWRLLGVDACAPGRCFLMYAFCSACEDDHLARFPSKCPHPSAFFSANGKCHL